MSHTPSRRPGRHANSAVRAAIAVAAWNGKGHATALAIRCRVEAPTIEEWVRRLDDATRRLRLRSDWWL